MRLDIQSIVEKFSASVAAHALKEPGQYCRWRWAAATGTRELGSSEYGCADAVNILYSIGRLPRDAEFQAACVRELQKFQNPETGLFQEPTHHPIHTTAHCVAALEILNADPLYPVTALEQYRDIGRMTAFLAALDWRKKPWTASHQGAGLFAAFVNLRMASREWIDAYFQFLKENADPEFGMGLRGVIQSGEAPEAHHLFGWFHYLFNHEYMHRPFPYPERLIDRCLAMYSEERLGDGFARGMGFREIDWVFAVNRSLRQTPHRVEEAREMLRDLAARLCAHLEEVDSETNDPFNDLHALFGTVCAVSELQIALPGELLSDVPLLNVLDRRPFI